jgi:hypothetical protein
MINEFGISDDTAVVTSSYVTRDGCPILEVSCELDEEGGRLWQFHCGNGDYSMDKMELVRLDTIIKIDPSILGLADLQMGQTAKRKALNSPWTIS